MNLTEEQLAHLVEDAVTRALASNRLHVHSKECPLSSDDVAFFKRLKRSLDTFASWLGHGMVLAVLGMAAYIVKLGIEAWRNHPHG